MDDAEVASFSGQEWDALSILSEDSGDTLGITLDGGRLCPFN